MWTPLLPLYQWLETMVSGKVSFRQNSAIFGFSSRAKGKIKRTGMERRDEVEARN